MIASQKTFINLNLTRGETDLSLPPGCESRPVDFESVGSGRERQEILQTKAWNIAISPASSIVMNFIMFWMIGSSLSIYTLFFVFTMISSQIRNLFGVNDRFKEFEGSKMKELGFYKLIYLVINLAVFGFCCYKLAGMGLLPFNPSDYVDLLPKNNEAVDIVRYSE